MADLSILDKATIDDDANLALPTGPYTVVSSDDTIATASGIGGYWYCIAQGAGTCTVTATRVADGAIGTLDVTVIPLADPGTFVIQLGATSPK